MSTTSSPIPGKIGQALNFNGSNYLTIDDSVLPSGASPRTISVWFKTTTTDVYRSMIEYGDLTDNTGVFFYVNGGTGKLNVDTFNSFWDANTIVNDGKWHMGTFTTDGATTRVYVDGRLDATNAQTFNTTVGVGQGRIGSDFNERHFPGTLDDMRIYNRALTATEI